MIKRKFLFMFLIIIITTLLPAIYVGGFVDSLKLYDFVIFFLVVIFLKNLGNIKIPMHALILLILFSVFFIFLIFVNIGELLDKGQKLVEVYFQPLYTKGTLDYFFMPKKQSMFSLVHLMSYAFIYLIALNIKRENKDIKIISEIYKYGMLIQGAIIIIQKYVLQYDRPQGTLFNAESAASYLLMALAVHIFYYGRLNIYLILDVVFIFLTGTRSGMVAALATIILFFFSKKLIKYALYIIMIFDIVFSVFLFNNMQFTSWFLGMVGRITSPYTILMRIQLWYNVFEPLLKNSLVFGLYGTIPSFTDNTIWSFLLPFGLLGFTIIMYFFYKNIKVQNESTLQLLWLVIFFVQGFAYWGFIQGQLAIQWWFLLGYFYDYKFENNRISA